MIQVPSPWQNLQNTIHKDVTEKQFGLVKSLWNRGLTVFNSFPLNMSILNYMEDVVIVNFHVI